jgi:hypothetical protein
MMFVEFLCSDFVEQGWLFEAGQKDYSGRYSSIVQYSIIVARLTKATINRLGWGNAHVAGHKCFLVQ